MNISLWFRRYSRGPMLAALPGLGLMVAANAGLGWLVGALVIAAFIFVDEAIQSLLRDAKWYQQWLLQVGVVSLGLGALAWVLPDSWRILLIAWAIHYFGIFMWYCNTVHEKGDNPPVPPNDPPIIRPPG
jgi:hypothetical protein